MAAAIDTVEKFVGVTTTTGNISNGTDARELAAFFRGYAADVRLKSTFSAMLAALEGVPVGAGAPAGWDPYAGILDRIAQGGRVYRRLVRMGEQGHDLEVCVLARLYGDTNLVHERPDFAELGPIIDLTAAAREAREDLVLEESTIRADAAAERVGVLLGARRAELEAMADAEERTLEKRERRLARLTACSGAVYGAKQNVADLEADVESTAGKAQERAIAKLRAARERLQRLEEDAAAAPAKMATLVARIAAGKQLLKQLRDGAAYDGVVRAQTGALAGTDREITVEAAIRAIMEPRKRSRATDERRARFVALALEQADTMRRAAHAAYRTAKAGDPPPPGPRSYCRVERDYMARLVTASVSGASP